MKNEMIKVRVEQRDKEILAIFSETLDVPISQIVREAIREKISELQEQNPEIKNFSDEKSSVDLPK